MRAFATGAGMFVLVLVVLLAAVGQLGKIDGQTLVTVLAASAIAGVIVAYRSRRHER
jgi:general stress protein CsbA